MRVLFFAQLKDATQCDATDIPLPYPVSANHLWEILTQKFPALAAHRSSVRLAKNHEYVSLESNFSDSDEVGLIPPVSGG